MNNKDFSVLDKQVVTMIPSLTDRQLEKVELWGEYSRQEQDKRFPEVYEREKAKNNNK